MFVSRERYWVGCVVGCLMAVAGCAGFGEKAGAPPVGATEAPLSRLAANMSGAFSSAEQSALDSAFRDIRLFVTPIWIARGDGPWLYVEQAAATALSKPYRQRIYHVSAAGEGVFESAVYELPGDPLALAGAWRTPASFDAFGPEALRLRRGCSVMLREEDDGTFVGRTIGTGCESAIAGAKYATSEVTVTPVELRTWDRGFNAENEQVWGARSGPYHFRRVTAEAAATAPSAAKSP